MKKIPAYIPRIVALSSCLVIGVFAVGHLQQTKSLNLSNVSVTLSNSRPSFRGGLVAGNTVGSSQITINTTNGAYPSTSSAQLVIGDLLSIGEAGSLGSYTVTEVVDNANVSVNPVLLAGDTDVGDVVIATSSSSLTIRLTTSNAVANGAFRFLIPAGTTPTGFADGIPDDGAFDFGTSAPTVTCPTNIAGFYDFVSGTASASSVLIGSTYHHSYECAYSGPGAIGTVFDGTTNDAFVISSVINPAPKKTSHSQGYADTYSVVARHLNSAYTTVDATTVSIGVIEAVRVTASVAPQITFRIIGVGSGATVCNQATTVSTTSTLVPLGSLNISTFTRAAQGLAVSTNASNGYVVTTTASDQLGRNGATCTGDNTGADCIPDSVGDSSAMSHTNPAKWSLSSAKGFAFSLDELNVTGAVPAFTHATNAGNCDGTTGTCFRQFADAEDSQLPQTIFSSSTVADNDNVYVCYNAIISASQAAGDYSNYITYTATATF